MIAMTTTERKGALSLTSAGSATSDHESSFRSVVPPSRQGRRSEARLPCWGVGRLWTIASSHPTTSEAGRAVSRKGRQGQPLVGHTSLLDASRPLRRCGDHVTDTEHSSAPSRGHGGALPEYRERIRR